MKNVLLYVQEKTLPKKMLEFFLNEHQNTRVKILTIVDLEGEQTAFLSVNNDIAADYHKNAQIIVDNAANTIMNTNKNIKITTSVIEGNINSVLLEESKKHCIEHILFDAEQEKKYNLVNKLIDLEILITVIPV